MSHRAKMEEKRRLEKLLGETGGYLNGCFRDSKGVLRRWWPYSSNANNKKHWRRISNRKFRRDESEALNGGLHKKTFDLWWTLY